ALIPLLVDYRQHLFLGDLGRIETDDAQVLLEIHIHLLNTWKPCQGFLNDVLSGHSGNALAADHVLDVQSDGLRGDFFAFRGDVFRRVVVASATGQQQSRAGKYDRRAHLPEHNLLDYSGGLRPSARLYRSCQVQKPTMNTRAHQATTTVAGVR